MRSVALAYLLKKEYNVDALAMGMHTSSKETRDMLFRWCDWIILTSRRYLDLIPEEFRSKLKVWHVGTDRWFKGYDPDLMELFRTFLRTDDKFLSTYEASLCSPSEHRAQVPS